MTLPEVPFKACSTAIFAASKVRRWCPGTLARRYPAQAIAIFAVWRAALPAVAKRRSSESAGKEASDKSRTISLRSSDTS